MVKVISRPSKGARQELFRIETLHMKKPSKSHQNPLDSQTKQQRSQRRNIVMMISFDDMTVRLKQLAKEGRQQDCIALMQELGDWQSFGRGKPAPILYVSPNLRGKNP